MFYSAVINAVLVISLVGGGSTEEDQTEVAILKQVNRVNDDGSYTFGYEAADGSFKIETRDVRGNVKGMFGYVDSEGELKKVSYSSSNNTGFQTTENTHSSASEREALLASFGTSAPASDRSDRKPILVLRDSALLPTKSPFIQYIPKKTESPLFGAREFTTPVYETSSIRADQNEDLFVNPDNLDSDRKLKTLTVPVVYPRKIVVTRRPVEDNVVSRGGNALRRQLSRRLNEREEDGVHVYGNELMNSNYYDKPMDAHTVIREHTDLEKSGDSEVRYEILEPKYRENRAGYVSIPVPEPDVDRTVVYPNQNAYPAASIGYRSRAPVPEPDAYRHNYPVTPPPPPPPPPTPNYPIPAPNPYPHYSATIVQSLREELMEFIMQYVHRRLNPYFQDYQTPYPNPYYRNPPHPAAPPYPNYPYPNYPPRNYPPVPPYPSPFLGGGPGPGFPYPVPNFPFMTPNVQYSTQSPGGSEGEASAPAPQAKAIRGRSGYIRRPYQFPPSVRENRDSRENRRQQYLYRTLATAATSRESSTIQGAASTTSSTTVVAPNSTPVRNIQILGTTPSPILGDSRPVTESPDEMEATS